MRIASNLRGAGRRVGIVLSRFNADIGEGLLAGALRALKEAGVEGGRHPHRHGTRRAGGAARAAAAGAERRVRRAGGARRRHPRRDVSLRDRRQRIGGGHRERRSSSSAFRSATASSPATPTRRRARGWRPRATRPRRRRSSSRTCWMRSMRPSPRRRARELVLQGLYERQLSGSARRFRCGESRRERRLQVRGSALLRRAVGAAWPAITHALVDRVAPHLDRKPADAVADRARDDRDRRVGAHASARDSVSRGHQRGGRAGEVVRRNRRPQVRQRRARQARERRARSRDRRDGARAGRGTVDNGTCHVLR